MKQIILLFPSLLLLFLFNSCFPGYDAVEKDLSIMPGGNYKSSAKVFRKDNSYVLFEKGYSIDSAGIYGAGRIIRPDHEFLLAKNVHIPFDSITAMVAYENEMPAGRYIGSCLLVGTGIPMAILSVYCAICPKCCFGSCPTIYTVDGLKETLQAELFSECISKQLENSDMDVLRYKINGDCLQLKITNEAMETHFINKFDVAAAEHPAGTEVYQTINNEITAVYDPHPLFNAADKEGKDISEILSSDDDKYFRSGSEKVQQLKDGPAYDYIDLEIPAGKEKTATLVMKYRNTLLSTTLLYDVVIGSQGINAMEWQQRMNEDPVYASMFRNIYDAFSGINIRVMKDGEWENAGRFKDAGPLNWKYIAAEIPSDGKPIKVRLEFVPDNFMIDYIAYDYSASKENIRVIKLSPERITDRTGSLFNEFSSTTSGTDDKYLVTEPGDFYNINYNVPGHSAAKEMTPVIFSKGYYYEWIRGDWITSKEPGYKFNLMDIRGTLSRLADSWSENRTTLEHEFFRSRFILKEAE